MQVMVRYFAGLRELRGCGSEALELDGQSTVGELYAHLFPPGPQGTLPVMFALNASYVDGAHAVSDGDEVAFIPPLGGG
jgi:molybdopterin converting factor subunit 1